jgi:hypothetical protein
MDFSQIKEAKIMVHPNWNHLNRRFRTRDMNQTRWLCQQCWQILNAPLIRMYLHGYKTNTAEFWTAINTCNSGTNPTDFM